MSKDDMVELGGTFSLGAPDPRIAPALVEIIEILKPLAADKRVGTALVMSTMTGLVVNMGYLGNVDPGLLQENLRKTADEVPKAYAYLRAQEIEPQGEG